MSTIVNHVQVKSSNAPTENAIAKIEFEENPKARLSVTKKAVIPRSPVFVGDKIQYVITVKNIGSQPALNVVVIDNAPNNVVFTGAVTTVGFISVSTFNLVVATIGTLNPGQTAVVTINGTIV